MVWHQKSNLEFQKNPPIFFSKNAKHTRIAKKCQNETFFFDFQTLCRSSFPNKNIVFCKVFCHSRIFKSLIFSYLFTFLSAVCLLFCLHCQLIVYFFYFQAKTLKNHDFFFQKFDFKFLIFSCLFTFFVYIVSCLFTFIKIWIFAPKLSFPETFCHYDSLSPKLWNWKFLWVLSFLNFQFFLFQNLVFQKLFVTIAPCTQKCKILKKFLHF